MVNAERLIHFLVVAIDEKIQAQVVLIENCSAFQKLKSSWYGLYSLLNSNNKHCTDFIIVRMLCISMRELMKDCIRSSEFDQSNLFKLIYSDEYDHPGGEPFGVCLLYTSPSPRD